VVDILHGYFSVDVLDLDDKLAGPPATVGHKLHTVELPSADSSEGVEIVRNSSGEWRSSMSSAKGSSGLQALSLAQGKRTSEEIFVKSGSSKQTNLPRQEGFFFKYLKIGEINVEVNTSGYSYCIQECLN
jgi:hypothetical protein